MLGALEAFSKVKIKKESTGTPEITVIIPTYNRAAIAKECLDKLAQTTYDKEKLEVILVDDHSTDETFETLLEYEAHFANILILQRKENSGGASAPRNDAMRLASGKWLTFIDCDDYITEETLTDVMAVIESDKTVDMVCMPYFRSENSNRAISKSAFEYELTKCNLAFKDTKLFNSLNAVGKVFRKSLIDEYAIEFPLGITVREDNWFMMKIYSVSKNIAILGNTKQYYFVREQDTVSLSVAGTPPKDAVKIFLEAYNFIVNLSLDKQDKQDLIAIFLNRYTNMIKRGKFAPVRFFDHTKEILAVLLLTKNKYLTDNSSEFISDLFNGKYDIK